MAEAIIPVPLTETDRTIVECCINAKRLEYISSYINKSSSYTYTFQSSIQLAILIDHTFANVSQSQSIIVIYPGMTNYQTMINNGFQINVTASNITYHNMSGVQNAQLTLRRSA